MRIIGGFKKGKKLYSPITDSTQPTMDRAKETLFNMLESWCLQQQIKWNDISFLDAFSGSGSIGLEAVSRGVQSIYFMENNPQALKVLNQNLALFGLPATSKTDATNPPLSVRAMNLIFMDAPYGKGLCSKSLLSLLDKGWIDSDTLIIVETDKKAPEIIPDKFKTIKERSAGRNLFLFLKTRS